MAVHVLVVGAGWWCSRFHVPALESHPDAVISGVVDAEEDRAERAAATSGARVFANLEQALASGGHDAALVATPSASHHDVASATLGAGLHTFVEKPLALTAADARDLVHRAEAAGLHLAVGYTSQHASAAEVVRRAVRDEIGDLLQVTVEFTSSAGGLYEAAARGEESTTGGAHPSAYTAANGGGQAHTQLTHALGMLCWVSGQQVARVAAFTEQEGLDVDMHDAAAFLLEGGATGVAISSGAVASRLPVRQHIRYQGSQGMVEQDLYRATATVHLADGSRRVHEPDKHQPPYAAEAPARNFIDVILGRAENLGSPREAANTVAATEALLTAARESTVVGVARMEGP